MSSRDSYYQNTETYSCLKEWQTLIKEGQITAAISYWKAKKLRPGLDCYVCLKPNSWVPPLYYCCTRKGTEEMVKVLLNAKADPDQQPDSDVCDLLPFVCDRIYLKTLGSKSKSKSKLQRGPALDRSISHRLNVADTLRLEHLVQVGLLSREIIKSYVIDHPNIIEDKLKVMIQYLTYYYNIDQNPDRQLAQTTCTTLARFRSLVQYLISYGASVTKGTIDLCVDYYLYEIIDEIKDMVWPEPIYHTQMDSTKVAMMRPLLNDDRYVRTCYLTGYTPDPDVFDYDIKK